MPDEPKTRCAMCGHDFDDGSGDPIPEYLKCPNCKYETQRESLIGEWDDCAYDY